jgi:hypothetical protein
LSVLRPWRDALPNQTTPIFGLYAMRGWDFGTSVYGSSVYDSPGNTSKRFLRVVQGLQMPYLPFPNDPTYRREPSTKNETYTTDRDRILALRFWDGAEKSTARLYDTWLGEGFSPARFARFWG